MSSYHPINLPPGKEMLQGRKLVKTAKEKCNLPLPKLPKLPYILYCAAKHVSTQCRALQFLCLGKLRKWNKNTSNTQTFEEFEVWEMKRASRKMSDNLRGRWQFIAESKVTVLESINMVLVSRYICVSLRSFMFLLVSKSLYCVCSWIAIKKAVGKSPEEYWYRLQDHLVFEIWDVKPDSCTRWQVASDSHPTLPLLSLQKIHWPGLSVGKIHHLPKRKKTFLQEAGDKKHGVEKTPCYWQRGSVEHRQNSPHLLGYEMCKFEFCQTISFPRGV